jgi:hypothetical protein
MKNPLKKLFPFLWETKWNLKEGHEVEKIFESKGVDYYAFVNEQKIPAERAFYALDIYTELEQRSDATYHEASYNAIVECLKKGDNIEAGAICKNSLARMKHITNIDLLYKLASVYYFDKNENCYSYDYEYAEKKIARWKKDEEIESFFLKTPLGKFLPSFSSSSLTLETYTLVQRRELIEALKHRLSLLSGSDKHKDLISKVQSQIMTLESLVNLEN